MDLGIQKTISDGNGNAIVFTALAAAALANCIPSPADGIFFYREKINKDKLESGKITPKQFWTRSVFDYYFWTAGYYGLLFLTLAAINKPYKTNAKILLGLIGAGVVVGVVARNIKKDEQLAELQK